jgi:hypothetical protein
MPAAEIKELRKEGKLNEAFKLAKEELELDPNNIWAKRNLSWVYYDFLKNAVSLGDWESFTVGINALLSLQLPAEEKMLFEQLSWLIGKLAFKMAGETELDGTKVQKLLHLTKQVEFPKPSEGYSFLFKGFHKLLKATDYYLDFSDWWGFNNFLEKDFNKETLANGMAFMSIAEQAYIAYSKHLLPKNNNQGQLVFHRDKVESFMPKLDRIIDEFPQYQYPSYYKAKLLLALGNKDNLLESLLPFAKKKRNDFWVWDILAEAYSNQEEKVMACYCMALSCNSPQEMLVGLRQKLAKLLIVKGLYSQAKTEIELLVQTRKENQFKIPAEVVIWQLMPWYKSTMSALSNKDFYKEYLPAAEELLFLDIPEELVFVDFVNSDKKIANFISSESKYGYFKYERFLKKVKVGDVLKVRFQDGKKESLYRIYSARIVHDENFSEQFVKDISGVVKMPNDKPFGFLENAFIPPNLISKYKLSNGVEFSGKIIKTFNREKNNWGWKLI